MSVPSRKGAEAKSSSRRLKAPARLAKVRLANAEDQAAPSPALQRQDRLNAEWIASQHHAAEPGRWSQRRTVAFVVLTCGGFWACVAYALARLTY